MMTKCASVGLEGSMRVNDYPKLSISLNKTPLDKIGNHVLSIREANDLLSG